MSEKKPLSDDEIETVLHEMMRQIVSLRAETEIGQEALRTALVGPYGALMRMERRKSGATDQDAP